MFERLPSEYGIGCDPVTGERIIRWTSSEASDQHLYFTSPSVTVDGKYLVVISERAGVPNLYAIERDSGELCRVSDSAGVLRSYVYPAGGDKGLSKVSPYLDAKRSRLYWIEDYCVWMYDIQAKAGPYYVCDVPYGWVTGYTTLTEDGQRLCVACADPQAFSRKDYSQHDQLARVPRRMVGRGLTTRLCVIDIEAGSCDIFAEVPFWVTHVHFIPHDKEWILCNSEGAGGSGGKRSFPYWGRVWKVSSSGRFERVFCQAPGESVNHENLISGGRGFVCHGRMCPKGAKNIRRLVYSALRRLPGIKVQVPPSLFTHYVEARRLDGYRMWRIQMDVPVSHAVAIGETEFLYDSPQGQVGYCRIDDSGTLRCRVLACHNSSMTCQDAHPHPTRAAGVDGVVYASDAEGAVNVYEVRY